MPPDLVLLLTLISLNYPCLEHIFVVPKVFEPLKFYSINSEIIINNKVLNNRILQKQGIHQRNENIRLGLIQ